MCPEKFGQATTPTGRGCPDADEDGWANFEDDLPYDDRYHVDSDGDGVADEEDDYPYNALLNNEESVFSFGCFLFMVVVAFVVYRTQEKEEDSVTVTKPLEPIVVGQLEEEDSSEDGNTFW